MSTGVQFPIGNGFGRPYFKGGMELDEKWIISLVDALTEVIVEIVEVEDKDGPLPAVR